MERIVFTFFSVVLFVFGATCCSSAQTKKVQISFLQLRIDSLDAVLEETRIQLNDSQKRLKDKISSSTETETRLNAELSTKSKTLQELRRIVYLVPIIEVLSIFNESTGA